MRRIDVAIIGGSLAGATCVRELTRLGVDAVAFEREEFPRKKVCGGFVSPRAVRVLEEIGMLAATRAAGATEVRTVRIRTAGVDRTISLPRPGLGISRKTLDALFAEHPGVQQGTVRSVEGETIQIDETEVRAKVVIDAAGKLSRFTRHAYSEDFGVQFDAPAMPAGVLDFWFFDDGYGGAVAVEEDRTNCSFLITKDALPRYIGKPGCLVTGPIAYNSRPSPWIAIGDAAGMIDPFCGEGMHHALDTGRLAAQVVADGLRAGRTYEEMRGVYRMQREKRWAGKRRLARWVRGVVRRPHVLRCALSVPPEWFLKQLWGNWGQ